MRRWRRATSPSGSAAYEGVVGWNGELGYGVRAPEADQERKDAVSGPPTTIDEHGDHGDDDHGHADHDDHGHGAH